MNTIFEKSSEKKSNVDEKILKPGGKNRRKLQHKMS
jgi:hypothetical protein